MGDPSTRVTRPPHPKIATHQLLTTISQHHSTYPSSIEARINLAIQALMRDTSLSERRAAALYNVPRTTLRDRRAFPKNQRLYDTYLT
ncbi:hypothetical protein K469DRAFT_706608 [Zopfia rhizophila CBS 207.26]|uniref:HTH psq-type domain-containing protein n=1 Tax=Zopfia rhizophila CBS 207.26 TaxID=1314779 RepID=A0A6A6E785_9PEZI|nr:hypothetical protein K469DRAFT_706608 [Zopfia rhizophila CBS 207.26]